MPGSVLNKILLVFLLYQSFIRLLNTQFHDSFAFDAPTAWNDDFCALDMEMWSSGFFCDFGPRVHLI